MGADFAAKAQNSAESCSDPDIPGTIFTLGPTDYPIEAHVWDPVLEICKKRAESGNAIAQYILGDLYWTGSVPIKQDRTKALKFFELSADQGYVKAQSYLGVIYTNNWISGPDFDKGLSLLRSAANQGDSDAQYSLAMKYQDGAPHIIRDYVQAYMWYNLACANGDNLGCFSIDELSKQMTKEQIAEGQKLSREWKPAKR